MIKCELIFVSLADIISAVEFNHDGELLATGDKGGRVVIFQRNDLTVRSSISTIYHSPVIYFIKIYARSPHFSFQNQTTGKRSSEYNVYSTFQSHEAEFDYLKSLEIEEKVGEKI